MKKFRFYFSYTETTDDSMEIIAADKDEAQQKFEYEANIYEDYEINRVDDLGEVPPRPEPPDPNQLTFEEPCPICLKAQCEPDCDAFEDGYE